MKAYKYTTTNTNAIDNREILFNAPLELGDVLRLVNYHTKYEFSLQKVEVDYHCKVLTVREAMQEIDSIVLHEKHEMFGYSHVGGIYFYGKSVSRDSNTYQINLSAGDFKEVREIPDMMLVENNIVGAVLNFCTAHDIKVTYNGSRAKLVIPVWNNGDKQLLSVRQIVDYSSTNKYYDSKFELILCEKQCRQTRIIGIKPMSKYEYKKPSEEQMNALKNAGFGSVENGDGPYLRELYKDLKTLM